MKLAGLEFREMDGQEKDWYLADGSEKAWCRLNDVYEFVVVKSLDYEGMWAAEVTDMESGCTYDFFAEDPEDAAWGAWCAYASTMSDDFDFRDGFNTAHVIMQKGLDAEEQVPELRMEKPAAFVAGWESCLVARARG